MIVLGGVEVREEVLGNVGNPLLLVLANRANVFLVGVLGANKVIVHDVSHNVTIVAGIDRLLAVNDAKNVVTPNKDKVPLTFDFLATPWHGAKVDKLLWNFGEQLTFGTEAILGALDDLNKIGTVRL